MPDRYAVIGNPVAHSKSPWIHAQFARACEQEIEYTRIEAPLDAFSAAVEAFRAAGGRGRIEVPASARHRQGGGGRGRVEIGGRAWSGLGSIVKVELGVDGEWRPAKLEEPAGRFAWLRWTAEWDAAPGEHVLSCRAADSAGNLQPSEPPWN